MYKFIQISPLVKFMKSHEITTVFFLSIFLSVVKPSGLHLKLALKLQDFGKAMFKPMRYCNIVSCLISFVWLCVTKLRPFISGRSDTRRHQKTSSISLTFRGTMQRLQPSTSTGEVIKTLMRVIWAKRQMELQSILKGRNELSCEESDMSKHRWNPPGTRH